MAPVRLARLAWFPRQARPSVHGGSSRTWNKCRWPWNGKNKQSEKQGFSNIIPSWIALAKLVTTCNSRFLAPHSLYLGPIQTMVAGCRDISANLPNTEHSLGEQFWNFAMTRVVVAPVRSARLLWWLPGQAKPSLHGGSGRIWNKCHWSWNVKSAMRRARSSPTLTWIPWENWWLPTTSQLHFFALHNLYSRPSVHGSSC